MLPRGSARGSVVAATLALAVTACSVPAADGSGGAASPPPARAASSPSASPTPTLSAPTWETVGSTTSGGVARIGVLACGEMPPGTGFLVGPDRVLTAAHVVAGGETIALRFGDRTYSGGVLASDPQSGLALLHVDGAPSGHHFEVAPSPAPVGAEVAVMEHHGGRPLSVTRGAVTGVGLRVDLEHHDVHGLLRTDVAVDPRNDGGPLVDASGALVGVVLTGGEGAGDAYAVPADVIAEALASWEGVTSERAPEPCWDGAGHPDAPEVWVTSPSPDAPFVAELLKEYGTAINARQYSDAWIRLTPTMQEELGTFDEFALGNVTSRWTQVEVVDVEVVDAVTDTAVVALRTEQAAEHGRDGATCTDWRITYRLTVASGEWQVDGATFTDGVEPEPCPEEEFGD